jgi:hypothetical protein
VLEERILELERVVAERQAEVANAPALDPAPTASAIVAPPELSVVVTSKVRYTAFQSSAPGVSVHAGPGGSMVVKTSNPELAGKTVIVQATRADGTTEILSVKLPES